MWQNVKNWWIWAKDTQEFPVLFLQLFCKFEITSKEFLKKDYTVGEWALHVLFLG